MSWDPVAEPWRLELLKRAGGLTQWTTIVTTYATEAAAREELARPFGAGVFEGRVSFAVNAATWAKNGRWRTVARRKRAKVTR